MHVTFTPHYRAVLENHHVAFSFKITLDDPQHNIYKKLDKLVMLHVAVINMLYLLPLSATLSFSPFLSLSLSLSLCHPSSLSLSLSISLSLSLSLCHPSSLSSSPLVTLSVH